MSDIYLTPYSPLLCTGGLGVRVHLEFKKCYVGSSVNLGVRLSLYINYNHISGSSKNMMIYRALLKYGYSGFRLEILEYCSV
jgi:group I intron endonuclease